MVIALRLAPVDTWQFGLGIPSQAGSASQLPRQTAMPPSPTTVAGALRAELARVEGWSGEGSWAQNPALVELVGDGPDDYGKTTFCGPLLADRNQLLVPVPAATRHRPGTLLFAVRPGEPVCCDLGSSVPLPTGFAEGQEVPEDGLLFVEQARALLGRASLDESHLLCVGDLWAFEYRTGIQRNPATRTVAEGALFDLVHVRPRPGHDPALVVVASGDEDRWAKVSDLVPFGAEGRLAWLERWPQPLPCLGPGPADLERIGADGQAALLVVTPLLLEQKEWRGEAPLRGLEPARVLCAVGPRTVRLGGWDGRRRVSTPQRSWIAPGTVLFVHADAEDLARALERLGSLPQIGSRTAAGFGLVLVAPLPAD